MQASFTPEAPAPTLKVERTEEIESQKGRKDPAPVFFMAFQFGKQNSLPLPADYIPTTRVGVAAASLLYHPLLALTILYQLKALV